MLSFAVTAANGQVRVLFTQQEQDWMDTHPLINVAVDDDWRPIEYIENGVYKGLSAEYLRAVSKISGLQFRWVPGVGGQDGGRQALLDGKVELLPAISKILTPVELRNQIAYSAPYFVGASMVVTPADSQVVFALEQMRGKKIAIKAGGVYERMLRQHFPSLQLFAFSSVGKALDAVESGLVDAAIGVDAAVMPVLRRRHFSTLHIAGVLGDIPVVASMGVRPDDQLLLSIIDKSLASLTAQQTDQMLELWMEDADYGVPSWGSILQYYTWSIVITMVLILALLFTAYWAMLARRRAERSERDKAMFIAVMSHEIRTPMNAILSSVELLERSALQAEQAHLAKVALSGANALLDLLNDVLDFSKIEADRLELNPSATNIGEVVCEVASIAQVQALEKGIPLILNLDLKDDVWPVIDANRIRQVLNNLLSNSVKFTETGRIQVAVKIEQDSDNPLCGRLSITVQDSGIGIPKSRQRTLFKAFTQVDQSNTRKFGGTGLGLAICKELVELMGGDISLQSEPGCGVTVQVDIAVAFERIIPASEKNRSVQSFQEYGTEASQKSALSILVVEDHPQNRFVIERQLQALGYTASLVETGQAALDAVARSPFDIVLLDCNLPDMDGYAVATKLRAEMPRDRGHLPIIAISAMVGAEHIEACHMAGMDGIIAKPLRLDELREMIELWCSQDLVDRVGPIKEEPCLDDLSVFEGFFVTTRIDLEELWCGLAVQDWEQVAHKAHRIAGAAKTIGLKEIAGLASTIERNARTHETAGLRSDLVALENACNELQSDPHVNAVSV